MKNILKKVNKKKAKSTLLTILLLAIVIALYFEINVLVKKLNISDIDMTDSKLYSLTDESKEKIKKINEKLEIQLVNFDEYLYLSNISNSVDVIKEYSKVNNNIAVNEINDADETSPSIIFKYKDKTKKLSIDDIYTYKFSTDTYNNESIDATEETITNAITEITTENTKSIYLYLTHSTYKDYTEAYFATLINKLGISLNKVNYLDLSSTESIPADCDCLVIPNLSEDISEKEKDILINYIKNGGDMIILQESNAIINANLPNFQTVIDLYGISFSDGIVMEGNTDNMLNSIPEFIIAKINSDSTIGKNLNRNSKILLVDPGKIDFKDEETLKSLNVSYEIIAQASDSAFLRKNLDNSDYTRLDTDEDASNAILSAMITKKVDGDKTSKLIVFSNSIFATDSTAIPIKDILTGQSKKVKAIFFNNNEEVLEHSIKYLSDNTDSLILRKGYYDDIPTMKIIKSGTIVQILYGIPMLIILIGYVVWRIRRNKK